MIKNSIDNAIALRIIYLLTKPFNEWPAFKEGIIDSDGEQISPGAKSNNWTMLHRLVARIKKMLGIIPGGKTNLASYLAAYALVKENLNNDNFENQLLEARFSYKDYIEFVSINEEGESPANTISNVDGIKPGDEPPARKQKKILKRRYNDRSVAESI